jgi:hypothetical protein
MQLREHIKETLLEERKRKLSESFNQLSDIKDIDFFSKKITNITLNLMNEGYSLSEIESSFILFEEENPWDFSKVDFVDVFKNSMVSGAKEYIINFVLTQVFGANRDFAATASVVFADYNPLDLLKIFKDEQSCNPSMRDLSDSLLEAVVRYIGGKSSGVDRTNYGLNIQGASTTAIGNVFGEAIRQSNIGETISSKFCKMIH